MVSKCASLQGKTVEKVKWACSVLFLSIFMSAFRGKNKEESWPRNFIKRSKNALFIMYNLAWLQTGTALRMDQQQFLHLPGFSLAAPICWYRSYSQTNPSRFSQASTRQTSLLPIYRSISSKTYFKMLRAWAYVRSPLFQRLWKNNFLGKKMC